MGIQKLITEERQGQAKEKLDQFCLENAELIDKLGSETQTSILELCFATDNAQKGYDMARIISKQKPSKALLDRIKNAIASTKK